MQVQRLQAVLQAVAHVQFQDTLNYLKIQIKGASRHSEAVAQILENRAFASLQTRATRANFTAGGGCATF